MAGSFWGHLFRVGSFGESHGPALGCVIDGVPPLLELDESDIQKELDRRRPGTSRHVTQRREEDRVEILSGVFEGRTTGTPIALLIRNGDQRSRDYDDIKDAFRPGHADMSHFAKYGVRDHRGGGRSSARETVARVAAGAVARKWLERELGVVILSRLLSMGEMDVPFEDWSLALSNPFNAPCRDCVPELEAYLDRIRSELDSVGGRVEVVATGVPPGLGDPVFDKLDARIAHALMGVNAVKSVEIGEGLAAARLRGSVNNDQMTADGFLSNHAGGVLGGVSTGQDLVARVGIKPTPSIAREQRTIDRDGKETLIRVKGRHDPCVALRAGPILEAMMALVLIDEALKFRAYGGLTDTGAFGASGRPEEEGFGDGKKT